MDVICNEMQSVKVLRAYSNLENRNAQLALCKSYLRKPTAGACFDSSPENIIS